jgi:hypothetical protein
MGLRNRPNNCVKSNSYDGRFLPSVTGRFGYSMTLAVTTRDHARVYWRLRYICARKGGPRASRRNSGGTIARR